MQKKSFYQRLYRRWLINRAYRKRQFVEKQNKKMERTIQVIAGLFFTGLLLTGIFGTPTLLSWWQISRIFIFIALMVSFVPANWLPKIFSVFTELKILLSVCGIAPFLTGLLLLINFTLTSHPHTETYRIIDYKSYYHEDLLVIQLENNQFGRHTELRRFPLSEQSVEPDSVVYTIKKGVLGMKVVKGRAIIGKR